MPNQNPCNHRPGKCLDCGKPRRKRCGQRCRACYSKFSGKVRERDWKRRRTRLRTMPDGPLVGTVDMAAIFANLDRAEAKALAAAAAIINKKGPAG